MTDSSTSSSSARPLVSELPAWSALQAHVAAIKQTHLRDLLTDAQSAKRSKAMFVETQGICCDFSRQNATLDTLDLLFDLADQADVQGKIAAMRQGEHVNRTEDRAVMHMALRADRTQDEFRVDGQDVVPEVHRVLDEIEAFSAKVRSGALQGATGKKLTSVVAIGIGGSYLGAEYVHEALRFDPQASQQAKFRRLRFLANVDPVAVARTLEGLDPETTLIVIISKTFTTAETMLNAKTVKDWLVRGVRQLLPSLAEDKITTKHMCAVSASPDKAAAFGVLRDNVFGFWNWVGGRYSVTSAVGVLPLALQYGFEVVKEFLAGARSVDQHFLTAAPRENLPLILGLLGVWNSSFLGHSSRCLLPYSEALCRLAAHIQQVDMESNGKRVSDDGRELPFQAGEVNFGEPGTNGQHSFYQLIHQGRVVPADFLGFSLSQYPISVDGEPVANHDELMSNFFAQPDALAFGKTSQQLAAEGVPQDLIPHKVFAGNRPSTSLLFERLSPRSVGQILSLFEHRTAVQGFIWGVNSFDQWGVELGKVLGKKVRTTLQEQRATKKRKIEGYNASTTRLLTHYLHAKSSL